MKARKVLPGLSRAIIYVLLAIVLVFPALGTVVVQAASTISLRSVTSNNNQTGATKLIIARPSGTALGDVLIAQIVVNISSTSITAPPGWHLIRSTTSGSAIRMASYYRIASSSEPAAYTWTFGSGQPASGGIADFIGVSTATPVDVSSGRVNANTGAASFAQVTTSVPNDMLLAFVGVAGNTTVTPTTGFTERYERRDLFTKNGKTAEMSQALKGTIGQTSVGSAKEDTLSVTNVTQLVALRPAGSISAPTFTPTPAPIVIAAVGDMECQTSDCNGVSTPNQIAQIHPSAFFPVGDLVWVGYYSNFVNFYNPSWGQFFSISHPALGNHDGSAGYFTYWNGSGSTTGRAGPTGEGWYSFNKGNWHFVVLNSNCVTNDLKVSCAPGSAQINWLQNDLASHSNLCTIAFTHIPYYTSGPTQYPELQTMFQTLYTYHVDLLVTGHTHYYQRFYPQNANGQRVANGTAEITVGTGGGDLSNVQSKPSAPNQAVQLGHALGVLKLTLNPSNYSYRFLPAPGYSGSDAGSANCH